VKRNSPPLRAQVIVSRTRYISKELGEARACRVLGLSTALANPHDLADWLGVDPRPGHGLYNFAPAVRPVKMDAHIRGFPGKHYCPRMATMNKPTYQARARPRSASSNPPTPPRGALRERRAAGHHRARARKAGARIRGFAATNQAHRARPDLIRRGRRRRRVRR
jgi:hypothetical protein